MASGTIITFTTDFGHEDTFVGQMKGAALAVSPDVVLVDLTHEVPPQDVVAASFLLWTGYRSFPEGTIHVAVVDPGVGTERRGLAVRTSRYTFVAPDNGLLTRVLEEEPVLAAHELREPRFRRPEPSPTFHGRDVFAPAAAWLARGIDPAELGPEVGDDLVRIDTAPVDLVPGQDVRARVLVIDRFGNATLDIPRRAVDAALRRGRIEIVTPGGTVSGLHRTYSDGESTGPFLVVNSAEHLEIALWRGSAADRLGLETGAEVTARLVVE